MPVEIRRALSRPSHAWHRGFLLAVLLLAACGPSSVPRPAGPLPIQGLYSFHGRVHGRNQYRFRAESFTKEIEGTVEFGPGAVHVYFGTYDPTCEIPADQVEILTENHLVFYCNGRLEFGDGWGRAVVPVTEEREQPGNCLDYEMLPDGRRGRCLEWIWVTRSRTTRKTTSLSVRKLGGGL